MPFEDREQVSVGRVEKNGGFFVRVGEKGQIKEHGPMSREAADALVEREERRLGIRR